jgi:predicted Zn-dependent protease
MSRKVSKSSSHGGGVKGQKFVPYVAGFHLPSPEEVVEACGCFPWTGDTFKSKHREDILLGKGGGGKTTRESIQHLDIPHYYQQDLADKQFWCDLPAPADDSSWLAQVNEPGQTFDEYVQFITLRSGKFKPNSNSENANIYLLPLSEEEGSWPQSGPALDGIIEYVSAFFCREVVQLDYVHLRPNPGRPARKSVVWKTGTHECEIAGRISANDSTPRFQCHVDGLLTEIAAVRDDGSYNGQEISNAFALIGVTMSDLFSGDTDLFIAGMAAGGSKVAVLSLARYHPHVKMCPFHWDDFSFMPSASAYSYHEDNKKRRAGGVTSAPLFDSLSQKSKGEYIRRAGKLIVHEICHVYGIDHCIHYHCLMNGTG